MEEKSRQLRKETIVNITKEQEDLMLHALGFRGTNTLNKRWKAKTILDKCYRNRYFVSKDWKPILQLVNLGYMAREDEPYNKNSSDCYHWVTEKGVEALKELANK